MKPKCELTSCDGNVFSLAAQVTRALRQAKLENEAKEFNSKLWKCRNYDEALCLMMEYCEVE